MTYARRGPGGYWGASCGLLAGALALGIAQLVAGPTAPGASPVLAVGQAAIDLTPRWLKTWSTSTFGTADKTVLLAGLVLVLALLAVITGILAVRRLGYGLCGLVVLAAVGVAAAVTRPGSSPEWTLPTLAGAAVGAL
ncbi:MAG: molybdopterin-binding oxidoreductase, partial [Nocardiopsaceae bacterium]|nr:molybdopterin-binding oxidoreductase [Nocardiopsaceae bacterium]